jgi:hypothetical protein
MVWVLPAFRNHGLGGEIHDELGLETLDFLNYLVAMFV